MARIQLMLADLSLALGFLLTTATQLRIPGSPIGPGELLLTFWLLITIGRGLLVCDLASNRALGQLLLFWLLFAASLCIGTIVAIATDEALDLQWFLHDAMAYPLVGMMVCLTVAGRNAQAHLDRVAWLFAALGSSSLQGKDKFRSPSIRGSGSDFEAGHKIRINSRSCAPL
jgi:hypothetical protein